MMKSAFRKFLSIIGNFLSNFLGYQLTYVVEARDWSIKNDGESVVGALNAQKLLRARISYSHFGLRRQIVHFGSITTFVRGNRAAKIHPSNKVVLTWFHVLTNDSRLQIVAATQNRIDRIHTSCQATKADLIKGGISEAKIIVIPLGVNLELFRPPTAEERAAARKELGVPEGAYVIGSFQKDGVGWGEGLEPKLIKGPDIFVETLEKLKNLRPFALLSGPARGYVKRELSRRGIPFEHVGVKKFNDLPKLYHALDLYLIASRLEGGPKSLLEAWASGVPVVSTRVGMVTDIAEHGANALLADIDDADGLIQNAARLLEDPVLYEFLKENARKSVLGHDWTMIARQYFENIYAPKNFSYLRK